jgi:triacylglycerol lipase
MLVANLPRQGKMLAFDAAPAGFVASTWQSPCCRLLASRLMALVPVILIHGIDDTVRLFRRMQPFLERRGFSVHSFNLTPNDGKASLSLLARQVESYVRERLRTGEPFDLVGFSMGGMIARYYVQRLGGLARVRRLITIAAPHRGTWTAYLRNNPGARDMRPGSPFLKDLNRDADSLGGLSFTSIWTPLDLMIVPSTSSRLRVGRSIPVLGLVHPLMVRKARVLQLVASILNEGDA